MKKLNVPISAGSASPLGWHVVLHEEDDNRLELTSSLGAHYHYAFWEGKESIPFYLRANRTFDLSTEENETLGYEGFQEKYPNGKIIDEEAGVFKPFMYWSSGLLKETIKSVEPVSGSYILITEEIKNVLNQFYLPTHRFYPATIEHELTKEVKEYFLFFIPEPEVNSLLKNALLSKMITYFGEIDVFDNVIVEQLKKYPQGTFDSYVEYHKLLLSDILEFDTEEDELIKSELMKGDTSLSDYGYLHTYYLLQEAFDMYWYQGKLIITEDLANHLNKTTEKNFKPSDLPPIYTGFNPEEPVPEELLNIPAPVE